MTKVAGTFQVPSAIAHNRLIDLGIIERGKGRSYMLSRKFYEFVGKAADYTRRKGLDREHNLALLKKHIDECGEVGAGLDELGQVLPSLPKNKVRSLLRAMHRKRLIEPKGMGRAARWITILDDNSGF